MPTYALRRSMALAVIVTGGFLVGLIIGRWWALAAPVALGVWAWSVSELEVPDWFIGLVYGGAAAVGVVLGIAVRRFGGRLFVAAPSGGRDDQDLS